MTQLSQGDLNEISRQINGCAIEIHSTLGPGLMESAHRACMVYELRRAQLPLLHEYVLPLNYKGVLVDATYRIDLWAANAVIVELKSVDAVLTLHRAQVLSYLRVTNTRLGLLINFNVPRLVDGVNRIVNRF